MKLLVLNLLSAKVILYNDSYLSVSWVITWFRNFILICLLFVSSSMLFSFQATGIIISMALLFWRWYIFFITSISIWCIMISKYPNKSSGGDPVIMWTFLCATHSGEKVTYTVVGNVWKDSASSTWENITFIFSCLSEPILEVMAHFKSQQQNGCTGFKWFC